MSNTLNQTEVAPVIVGDREILHYGYSEGVRITRIQRIACNGALNDVRFWTNLSTGQLHHVDCQEVK